jgi:integrase
MLSGLAVRGPDGLSDVMLDSLERGRAELRVRWDAGAKGRKARRVPITPQRALAIKRYVARHRMKSDLDVLLVNRLGRAYGKWGIDAMMDRLEGRVGFRVHAHGFRHTFATVGTQMGWNLERVRAMVTRITACSAAWMGSRGSERLPRAAEAPRASWPSHGPPARRRDDRSRHPEGDRGSSGNYRR